MPRCPWAHVEPLIAYHDTEWGVPVHEDRLLFEHLLLDNAQAGLSWLTILRKREGYRRAFANFDPRKVARFDARKVERILSDPGVIRNRAKVAWAVTNARVFLKVQEHFGSFATYLWNFVDGRPVINHWRTLKDLPASTPLSDRLSKDLKSRGFGFVGTTICYAFMQAVGLVNDHLIDCPRHASCSRQGRALPRQARARL